MIHHFLVILALAAAWLQQSPDGLQWRQDMEQEMLLDSWDMLGDKDYVYVYT